MDGIPVKVNEKYKPPPKISLPSCILNRLNNVQFATYDYDFSLEATVVQHVDKLNKISREAVETKTEVAGERQITPENEKAEERQSEAAILTPIPITSNPVAAVRQENRFKYSDFENDTSSPFDNEELKTLNDMEELAHVLGVSAISTTGNENGVQIPVQINGQWSTINYGSPTMSPYYLNNPYSTSYLTTQSTVPLHTYLPSSSNNPSQSYEKVNSNGQSINNDEKASLEIVESFRDYIVRRQRQNSTNDKIHSKSPQLPPTILSDDERKLGSHFVEMGFPLTRVTAAVKIFGSDETKIVEYLLLVQKFVDKGYNESQTIHALYANKCDEIQTEKYLKILSEIMKLGFEEEQVVTALSQTQNDRDKALDILIS